MPILLLRQVGLNFFFNTAQLPRWHYSFEEREFRNNYEKVISVWDIVFKNFYLPKDKEIEKVGFMYGDRVTN